MPRGEACRGERRADGRGLPMRVACRGERSQVESHPVNGSGLRMGRGSCVPEQAPQGESRLIWIETCYGACIEDAMESLIRERH